jgi:hypothetical protein
LYKTYTGRFIPTNPKKYKGDPTNIIYRSLWEKKMMIYFDTNSSILTWQSEEIVVPYYDPATGRYRKYFPDFLITTINNKTILIEIKPKAQTMEPMVQKRKTKKYITEVMTWATNSAKWKAAKQFCNDRQWEFKILTEDNIFGKSKDK